MDTLIIIISLLLITIVLLQSGKAEGGSSVFGGSSDLFSKRKERGSELFITRLTAVLGVIFVVLCIMMSY